jgi:hypothetical protein
MAARRRFTKPMAVRLHEAQECLKESRDLIDSGQQEVALWRIMHALLNLKRVRRRLDDEPS